MTNLAAIIFFTITTNWGTVSTTYTVLNDANYTLKYTAPVENQIGVVSSNTYAKIKWNGKFVDVLLESKIVGKEERSQPFDGMRLKGWK